MTCQLLVPNVWHSLLLLDDLSSAESSDRNPHEPDDESPFVDDCRVLETRIDDRTRAHIRLQSGQSNYWFEAVLLDEENIVTAMSTPFDAIPDTLSLGEYQLKFHTTIGENSHA